MSVRVESVDGIMLNGSATMGVIRMGKVVYIFLILCLFYGRNGWPE